MKTVFALSAIFFSSAATAVCYQVFSPDNVLVWQGRVPPVAMDTPSSDTAIKTRFPGGHLVIVDDPAVRCYFFDAVEKARDEAEARPFALPE